MCSVLKIIFRAWIRARVLINSPSTMNQSADLVAQHKGRVIIKLVFPAAEHVCHGNSKTLGSSSSRFKT